NVGTAKPVTAALVLGGTDASKYTLTQPALTANITQATQTITFNTLADKTTASAPYTLNGTASSGLAITYVSSNTSVVTISGSTATIVGSGDALITASQPGNINYSAATDVARNQHVTIAPSIVTWTFGA